MKHLFDLEILHIFALDSVSPHAAGNFYQVRDVGFGLHKRISILMSGKVANESSVFSWKSCTTMVHFITYPRVWDENVAARDPSSGGMFTSKELHVPLDYYTRLITRSPSP